VWKPFRYGDDVILSMIHLSFFCHKLAFMDDTSAPTPHLGHVKGMIACHSFQILEDLTFLAFSMAAVLA